MIFAHKTVHFVGKDKTLQKAHKCYGFLSPSQMIYVYVRVIMV